MKNIDFTFSLINKKKGICLLLLMAFAIFSIKANSDNTLRRPITPQSPTWLIHIDTWTYPDPQKCIDLVPEDIRPYVIFNISLSVSSFVKDKYPFSIAESWIRTCAENGVWATIQPSSGAPNNFSDTSLEEYEYFFVNYPNFLGWNFCEQSWGFSSPNATLAERIKLFIDLLKLSNEYGGYLIVSHTLTMASPGSNALAMLKNYPEFATATKTYMGNYIVCEKYTTTRGFYDIESTSLGTFLSKHAGNYGIRFDQCGWPEDTWGPFAEASGGIPIIEHALLTGQTVMDGPELTRVIAIIKDKTYITSDGYTAKSWSVHPSFTNINIDIFRKILDGTIRIPTREEVIKRTKIAYVNDATTGDDRNRYSSEQSLFTGLYAMDGEWDTNNVWFKKTGRYPTIPSIYKVGDYETGDFEKIVTKSNYSTTWASTQSKVNEFNTLFPKEYTGDIYAGRMYNSWVTYSPYMDNTTIAEGIIQLKYNTCDELYLSHSPFSMSVVNETSDKIQLYLNNFCTNSVYGMRDNVIKIFGCNSKPTWNETYRGDRNDYTISENWNSNIGIFTLSVKHNGPIDITINCSGNGTGKPTDYPAKQSMIIPERSPLYTGVQQYEAENFDWKSISGNDKTSLANYTAMAYLAFGTNVAASIRKTVNVREAGTYQLQTRYNLSGGDVNSIDLYVNGTKIATLNFTKTSDSEIWGINSQIIDLKAGDNEIMFKANKKASYGINFDNITLTKTPSVGINEIPGFSATVIYTEYYNLNGLKISNIENCPNGVYIVRDKIFDGSVSTSKIIISR